MTTPISLYPDPTMIPAPLQSAGGTTLKEKAMTSTLSGNGTQRKSLASQIDRLDSILDGLADALNESVSDAVREVVGQAVREAVQATVREVLASPELLRAALHKHSPAVPTPAPAKRQPLKGLLQGVRTACAKVKQATVHAGMKLGRALAWGLDKLRQGCAVVGNHCKQTVVGCIRSVRCLGTIGTHLWRFRRSCTIALTVGVISGVGSYLAGPLIASVASGVSGAALTLAGMILLPLGRLLMGSTGNV
jgi:hypothetical protein